MKINKRGGLKNVQRKLVLIATVVSIVLAFASVANAADANTIPHGGYSESTNSCLSCHDIHEAAGDYVLMREATVTETCGTCHTLYTNEPLTDPYIGGGDDPYPGLTPGTASDLRAYNIDEADRLDAGGHKLSQGDDPNIVFADEEVSDGNYIPGGTSTLTALTTGTGGTVDATTFTATEGLFCASCHTPHGLFGRVLRNGAGEPASDKLLSSNPNHTATDVTGVEDWYADGGQWCASCHDKRRNTADAEGNTHNNHPDTYCLTCHANYSGIVQEDDPDLYADWPAEADFADGAASDFPHTSPVENLLAAAPDELCITCHTDGSLP